MTGTSIAAACSAVLAALCCSTALAQSFPQKPVRIIAGTISNPGDIVARLIGPRLTERLGKPIVIDNRGALVGAELAAKAPPDGHTLFMGQSSTHATARALYRSLAYDPVRDFAPITLAIKAPMFLVAHPAVPAEDLKAFIELARKQPGAIRYAAPSSGSTGQLTMLLFTRSLKLDMLYVPYKAATAAANALLTREAQVSFLGGSVALPQVGAGRLKAYGVASRTRFAGAPEIPTLHEAGVARLEASSWQGLFAPARTPPELINRLNRDIVEALSAPEVRKSLLTLAMEPAPGTPAELAAFLKEEIAKWGEVIRDAGLKVD